MGERCRRCGESAHRYSPDHPQHGPQGRWDWQACVNSLLARAERAERERDALRADNDRLRGLLEEFDRFASIHPAYHGSDLAQGVADALSDDADADAEPGRPRCPTCEDTGLYPPGNDDGYGCWDCNQPPRRRDGTCAVCDQRRDPDAEPEPEPEPVRHLPHCAVCALPVVASSASTVIW